MTLSNKKGVEMTMSTIIIAVLVILVLVILVLIFSKSARNFFLGTSGCVSEGGECQLNSCEKGYKNLFTGNPECEADKGENYICCKKETDLLGIGSDD